MTSQMLHPLVLWAQRKDVVFMTICLEDTNEPKIDIKEDKMTFRSKGGHDQKEYGLEFTFYKTIVPEKSKQHITSRELTFALKKKEENEPYWPRLLSAPGKHAYIKTDFNKWKDEDDSEDENDGSNQNFEEMMKQMGDINTGEDVDGSPDSDDSDDDDMPGLEETNTNGPPV